MHRLILFTTLFAAMLAVTMEARAALVAPGEKKGRKLCFRLFYTKKSGSSVLFHCDNAAWILRGILQAEKRAIT